jgi:hypothetical protein
MVSLRFAVLLPALAVAGAATGAVVGSGNPTGQWAAPEAVRSVILERGFGLGLCHNSVCAISNGKLVNGPPNAEVVAEVLAATVTGMGPSKLIDGVRRYQLFDVQACTIYYYRGVHRFGVHFRWFTHRPPGAVTTTADRYGKPVVGRDDGQPYAKDWTFPRFDPLARDRC